MEYISRSEESEITQKRELLSKFQILRKKYPIAKIPEFSEFTDINTLRREYESIEKQLKIEMSVINYKQYLVMAFIGLEFVLKNFLQYEDIIGFANFQKEKMHEYESLLIEIGEKYYVDEKSQFPVEMRLAGMIFFNMATFVGLNWVKSSFSSGGSSGGLMSSLLGGLLGGGQQRSQQQQMYTNENGNNFRSQENQGVNKPRMRAPDIDIEDFTNKKFN